MDGQFDLKKPISFEQDGRFESNLFV